MDICNDVLLCVKYLLHQDYKETIINYLDILINDSSQTPGRVNNDTIYREILDNLNVIRVEKFYNERGEEYLQKAIIKLEDYFDEKTKFNSIISSLVR